MTEEIKKAIEGEGLSKEVGGKVLKKVKVTRGGKTFYQKRWVRISNAVEDHKKKKEKDVDKKEAKIHDTHIKDLKSHSEALSKMKPNEEKNFKGVTVRKLGDGSFTLRAHGKKVLVYGTSAASMIMDYAHKAASTGGAAFAGDLQGRGIERESAVTEASKRVAEGAKKLPEKTKEKSKEESPKEKKEKKEKG